MTIGIVRDDLVGKHRPEQPTQTTYEYLTAINRSEEEGSRVERSPTGGQSDAEEKLWSPERVQAVEGRVSFTARLGVDDPFFNVPQAVRPPWYTSSGSVSELPESGFFGDSLDLDAMMIGTPTLGAGVFSGSFDGSTQSTSSRRHTSDSIAESAGPLSPSPPPS